MKRFELRSVGALAAMAIALCVPAPLQAAAPDPDFTFSHPDLEGPCGVAISPAGVRYVSVYYQHVIRPFPPKPLMPWPIAIDKIDPLGGPCSMSFDSAGNLYVNNYHRSVERYAASGGGFSQTPTLIDSSHPTGVAVDVSTNRVYVDVRTHLTAYDSTGSPVMDGGEPLKVGLGSLGDGYGLAVSRFSATAGYLYVPDHADDTVKVYDPLVDKDDPVQTIGGPPGGFGSLRDSAVAVDNVSGEVYVADTIAYPQYTERPEATIYVFDHTGAYKGRLRHNVVDGSPPGLAVDNSANVDIETGPTQGRVYVTSGTTVDATIVGYPKGSVTNLISPPPLSAPAGPPAPEGSFLEEEGDPERAASPSRAKRTTKATSSVIAQKGTLRVSVSGKMAPKRLPRKGAAPISVSVGGQISTTDKSLPPQLKSMRIELNKEGRLDSTGLPNCNYASIQPGSSSRALSACRGSLVGEGSFTANITLSGQEPYPTSGKLLVFNAREKGKPVLYGHIYAPKPFATSFVIVFAIQKLGKGTYGTALDAPLPAAMDAWGRLTGLQMTLAKRYAFKGKQRSFISAGCPAPKGFPGAVFPLARTEFAFDGGKTLASVLSSECKAQG